MIAVVATADDVHYKCVAEELRRRGERTVLVEIPKLGNEARFSMATGDRRYQMWSVPGQEAIDLESVDCVWYRRFFPPVLSPSLSARADEDWAQREWRDAVTGAFAASPARFVSDPLAQERAGLKPYQLRLAQSVGLRIPDTLMTNDAEAALAFVRKHDGRVVHKVVKTPRDRWVGTKKWTASDEAELPWLYLTPTFFQEQIQARHELRITVVGRELFAAEFGVPPQVTDARSELDGPWEAYRLPDHVESRLFALMDRLGLQFGTIDMRRCENGEYVFLEVNPQGQFLFVEIKTGMPITRALAALLAHGR
jgi:MvdD-like protein with pre-ATP grasp domain